MKATKTYAGDSFSIHSESHSDVERVVIKDKFLYYRGEKFYISGVTYGTFMPQEDGSQFPDPDVIEKDFSLMAQHGINCVRTYTVPPKYLLDIATRYQLKVMAGLPWEQHISFLDTAKIKNDITRRVKEGAASCQGHPAILCYTIGNEIPASIVRWYGRKKIEKFLKSLYQAVKSVDPQSLVTYVNFPTTEYLDLNFLDFDCFNVYLETPEKLSAYIFRLHNLSEGRPLVLAEIGLDSKRNGVQKQSEVLSWQIKTVFEKGCAGMFVFAWTDDWWRGGYHIEDWDFGLVDRWRNPKPALYSVAQAINNIPFESEKEQPFISIVVCTYNGSATIRDTMEGIQKLDYYNYEVIVINDGSTDNVAEIVNEYNVRLITTLNNGLSSARNEGLHAAKGEIIAYIDDDAYPDKHWLRYLACGYMTSGHAGFGGPNIIPDEDAMVARCVANAPGGPVHVLITDEIAEHIPGCNMSFRRSALLEIGGFNPIYRAAGDDVDICWRIQDAGYTIGFHPTAIVWHHRRNSVKAYWKQQRGYGKAEALLEANWPEKYNGFGHLTWAGRIYGNGFTLPIKTKKDKVFYGVWGSALFQSIYQPADAFISALPLMPEWYLLMTLLGAIASLGFVWHPLLWVWGLFFVSLALVFIQAFISSSKNVSHQHKYSLVGRYKFLIVFLHIIQPVARLYGRLIYGLTPWRKVTKIPRYRFAFIHFKTFKHWSGTWKSPEDWLTDIETQLISNKTRVKKGGEFDRCDLKIARSMLSSTTLLFTVEEHGEGKQFIKLKACPSPSLTVIVLNFILLVIVFFAFRDNELRVAIPLLLIVLFFTLEYLKDCAEILYHINNIFLNFQKPAETEMQLLAKEAAAQTRAVFFHVKPKVQNTSDAIMADKD